MNPAERVSASLSGQMPDRVPVMELTIDWKVMRQLGYSDYCEMIDGLALDAIMVNQLVMDPAKIHFIDAEKKIYKSQWGALYQLTEEITPITLRSAISDPDDLKTYDPPSPKNDPVLEILPEIVERYKGRTAIGLLSGAVFSGSFRLVGMENLFMYYLTEPEFVKEIGRMVVSYNKEFHRLAIEAGVELIVLGDDYAHKKGTMMSPQHFREFILPGLREVAENIKSCGAYCIKHTDGNVWEIMDDMVECGVDGVGPLEPGAGMDLAKVKKLYPEVTVVGNVDVDLLCRATVEAVREETRRLIREVSPGGRHILSSGNSISSAVKPENLLAMIETAHQLGRY